jgi:N-acetylmuramoyl-L-alanine amidase
MNIIENPLTVNPHSRPGRPLAELKAIIFHWVGVGGQRARITRNWFETGVPGKNLYASAHYIIDLNGDIYHLIPDNEVAYHCGSNQIDTTSGKIYTDWARAKFGPYAENPETNSPNNCTIGIEMCATTDAGDHSPETLAAATELAAYLLTVHHLTLDDIGTHHPVVGWKDCPRSWTEHPEQFETFKQDVFKMVYERNN